MAYEEQSSVAEAVEPPVAVPIDASGSATAVAVRTLAFQLIGLAGALVAALGLPDTSVLSTVVRFLRREDMIPIIGLAAAAIASGWQLLRGLRKHEKFQVMSLLLPQKVAKSPENPTAAVATAAKEAIVVIEARPTIVMGGPTGDER